MSRYSLASSLHVVKELGDSLHVPIKGDAFIQGLSQVL